MYLNVRKYIPAIDYADGGSKTTEFTELVDSVGMNDFLDSENTTGAYVEIPVAYWRKANAVHKWFVDKHADGVDECQPIEVHVSHLKELVEACDEALKHKGDDEKVGEILPTEDGFFFGGTEYNDWYWECVEYTRDRIGALVELSEQSDDVKWYQYQASW